MLYKFIARKRYLIPLFFLLNDCMSVKSTPYILSLNCEYTFLLSNFLIIGKVKEEPGIPAGVPTTEAYEAILNIPNDADKVINILSKYQN